MSRLHGASPPAGRAKLAAKLVAAASRRLQFLAYFKHVRGYVGVMSSISGVFLVIFGLAIYSDSLSLITSFLERYGIGSYFGTDDS